MFVLKYNVKRFQEHLYMYNENYNYFSLFQIWMIDFPYGMSKIRSQIESKFMTLSYENDKQ